MKTRTSRTGLFLGIGAASLMAFAATAQTTAPSETPTPSASATEAAPAKLPYGVDDVLKLSRAQVSEDITLNYIKNSGTIYSLTPKEIVYLKNEGVSDKVVNAMMDQRQNVPADVANQNALQAQVAASIAPQASSYADPNAGLPAPVLVQPQPFYVEPTPVYVPAEPDYVPESTLYVIPYGPSGYGYLPPYRSFQFGSGYGCGSSIYYVGRGYGGPRYGGASYGGHRSYGGGHSRGGHGSTVYRMGRR
jgi:hypothetical protein